jgi:hypothetical protein
MSARAKSRGLSDHGAARDARLAALPAARGWIATVSICGSAPHRGVAYTGVGFDAAIDHIDGLRSATVELVRHARRASRR